MKIVVDENMPLVDAFFKGFGSVVHKPGRLITHDDLLDADALLIRSVTPVTASLLEGTAVQFVGSATIGVDHIDQDYLVKQGIGWASAPGCNADAVVNYVLTCLLELEISRGLDLRGALVGIVGYGNVGRRLKSALQKLGVSVVVCDPLLAEVFGEEAGQFVSLEEILKSDVISLHVPMVVSGMHPTYHMMDATQLKNLKANAVLINTSRGGVINNQVLGQVLEKRPDLSVVLDVWENEPLLDWQLANAVNIATPHIAGYSYDGKVKGTEMVYRSFCEHFGYASSLSLQGVIDHELDVTLDPKVLIEDEMISTLKIVRAVYSVMQDDSDLRRTLKQPEESRIAAFDQLRKNYRLRREFSTIAFKNSEWLSNTLGSDELTRMRGLGFSL
ncbi:MAG: 4-phosphoerythronate dehydrogenase [Moraxellaceae bacterium]|nr:MAG: 4-phosphoerythronate dehydrogenase [Moraxellaceae bacterium]